MAWLLAAGLLVAGHDFAGVNFVFQTKVVPGKLGELKSLVDKVLPACRATAGTLQYEWYFNADGSRLVFIIRSADEKAAVANHEAQGKYADPIVAAMDMAYLQATGGLKADGAPSAPFLKLLNASKYTLLPGGVDREAASDSDHRHTGLVLATKVRPGFAAAAAAAAKDLAASGPEAPLQWEYFLAADGSAVDAMERYASSADHKAQLRRLAPHRDALRAGLDLDFVNATGGLKVLGSPDAELLAALRDFYGVAVEPYGLYAGFTRPAGPGAAAEVYV